MKLDDKRLKLTPKRIEMLKQLGIFDTDALLSYYPFRYDEIQPTAYADFRLKERVVFEGEVISQAKSFRFGRGRSVTSFEVMALDHVFRISIFNRPWAKQLGMNQRITIIGVYQGGDKVTAISYNLKPLADQTGLIPVYSVRSGITQRSIHECIRHVFAAMQGSIPEEVPSVYRQAYKLLNRSAALQYVHFPNSRMEVEQAYRTLKYEEFLKFFLSILLVKQQNSMAGAKLPKRFDMARVQALLAALPFALTKDQSRAVDDVLRDLQSAQPMYRLVQGDVGCGKTLVAAAALYANALAGYQGALLAPTEILAQQHEKSVKKLLESAGIRVDVLYSGEKPAQKKSVLTDLAQGRIDVLIGTHSILQDNVVFQNLGLVIADEQQRFGVEQRRALRQKGTMVDFLLMSATPIPRTLASTLYGDMDISTIQTMPAGRRTPQTVLIQENSFRSVLDQVRALLKSGRQLYVICAAVEDSENYDARNVMDIYESLKKLFQNDCEVGVLHGRMSSEQKQAVMKRFAEGSIGVLVSTTVVEVGMNVVNATGMIVYDADRFGLSQLHQLRGRIQRGSEQGYCWLLTDSKDEKALERLQVLVRSNDGFEISYEDLRLRGPGDILGTRQSGVPDFILGNIVEDTKVIAQARKDAEFILNHAQNPDNAAILNAVQQKNSRNASYID